MQLYSFTYQGFTLELIAPNPEAANVNDVHCDGSLVSFDGGSVMIDFKRRLVDESPGVTLGYNIKYEGELVFAARNDDRDARKYSGGAPMSRASSSIRAAFSF